MSINMNNIEFPKPTYEQWKEAAIKSLKGKSFDGLYTKTIEGVTLQPLYTQEMLVEKLGDQLEKQISTIRTLKATDDFKVSQQIFGNTEDEFFNNLEESLKKGNQIITIDSRVNFSWNDDSLEKLADILTENSFKLIIQNNQDSILDVFHKIDEEKRKDVKGYIVSSDSVELSEYPKVKTYCANTIPYHYDGANAIQELAIALALAAKEARDLEYSDFAKNFFVNFAIDTQFFTEIAKLRAFKVLWKAFSSAYGVETIPVPVVAETSLRSFSKYDIYVNLLRAGNEALSALIGGADVFTVHPYDVLTNPTNQSIRIARNVTLVLKEESYVAKTLDPAGGSYFIETLTNEYVEKAWEKFLQIEQAGGIDAYKESGALHKELEEMYQARLQAVQTRKHSLIGTNIYANPKDKLATETNPLFADIKRLAIPFEDLREQFANIQGKIGVLTYGLLKNFKARADFVSGFFATAGVVVEKSDEITSLEEAKAWLNSGNYDYVVVCATDEDAQSLVPALLAAKSKDMIMDVAGKFKEEEENWKSNGLNGFIFAGQNIVEKLQEVVDSLKGVQR